MKEFILTEKAKQLQARVMAGEYPNDIMNDENDELSSFVEGINQSSDDFWYGLTNGYINYECLIADKDQKRKIEEAINLLEKLNNLVSELGVEW